ncbi:Cysteine/serine-rich nuclear protein 1 [Aphelenchoides avenae]|nr:Cysteine/serine-rich nuclear protein 1 [Aphelenchus avenae]
MSERVLLDDCTNLGSSDSGSIFSSSVESDTTVVLEGLKCKRQNLLRSRLRNVEGSDEIAAPKPITLVPAPEELVESPTKSRRQRFERTESTVSVSSVTNVCVKRSLVSFSSFPSCDVPDTDHTDRPACIKRIKDDPPPAPKEPHPSGSRSKPPTPCKVAFTQVDVRYYNRTQGFDTVPNTGGIALGMEPEHYEEKSFKSVVEYQRNVGREKRRASELYRSMLNISSNTTRSSRRSTQQASRILKTAASVDSPAKSNAPQAPLPPSSHSLDIPATVSEANEIASDASDNSEEVKVLAAISESEEDEDEVVPDADEGPQPLRKRIRRAILERAGVELEPTVREMNRQIRVSRMTCGCSCADGVCDPNTCECATEGIKCQQDKPGFPCACSGATCANPEGRVEFDPHNIHTHFVQTMMRLKVMEANMKNRGWDEKINQSPQHIKFNDDGDTPGTSTSYLSTPPPPIYKPSPSFDRPCTVTAQIPSRLSSGLPACVTFSTPPNVTKRRKRHFPVTPAFEKFKDLSQESETTVEEALCPAEDDPKADSIEETSAHEEEPVFATCPSLIGPVCPQSAEQLGEEASAVAVTDKTDPVNSSSQDGEPASAKCSPLTSSACLTLEDSSDA